MHIDPKLSPSSLCEWTNWVDLMCYISKGDFQDAKQYDMSLWFE